MGGCIDRAVTTTATMASADRPSRSSVPTVAVPSQCQLILPAMSPVPTMIVSLMMLVSVVTVDLPHCQSRLLAGESSCTLGDDLLTDPRWRRRRSHLSWCWFWLPFLRWRVVQVVSQWRRSCLVVPSTPASFLSTLPGFASRSSARQSR